MLLDRQKIYKVSELSAMVNAELSETLVRVQGEISDFKRSQNGKFIYFDLKDDQARMNCFIMAFQLHQELEDGMEVVATGLAGLYIPYGKYTFRVQTVEPVGEGALKRAFDITRRKLEAEGIFSPEYKKPLPRFPERIGLITSRDAAAYSDFMRILNNRWSGVEVLFMHVAVQGEKSAAEITHALHEFGSYTPVPDVVVLTRGGGSLEDLASFNDESVVRAIFASKIPVVVGVGHERDTSLCDLVADVRASTPSNAAERVVPSRDAVHFELDTFKQTLNSAWDSRIRSLRQKFEQLLVRLDRTLGSKIEKGRFLASRIEAAWENCLNRTRQRVLHSAALLKTLNPQGILKRGYSLTIKNGRILKNFAEVSPGDTIETILHKGRFISVVEE